MTTKNPRLMVTLETPVYAQVKEIAKQCGISLSLAVRDLIKKAIEWDATIQVLSDKNMMNDISDSLHEIKNGEKGKNWRKVLK
ncbi:MAG: hypothetical protein V1919_03020 [Candidatus Omnitrophota bacterium]